MKKSYNVIKVFEAFAGYGSQHIALKIISTILTWLNFEVVGISEINEEAVKAYHLLHGDNIINYGDISEINWLEVPDFDMFFYTFPCTDISWTGLKKGFEEGSGTRSSLLWECKKAIIEKKPKYLLMENVKSITYNNKPKNGKKSNKENLKQWIDDLKELGYKSHGMTLNASDFGIPQHRERYILVSILTNEDIEWEPIKCKCLSLESILEKNALSEYYLKKAA